MGKSPSNTPIRPLARSLGPLTGESLDGYLLRLAYRLHVAPIKLARQTGCAGTHLSRKLLLDLDIAGFARAARLTWDEAAALTLIPWAGRYPPIARSQNMPLPTTVDSWLFNNVPRHCPQCLAGDGSPVQRQYGGPWKTIWHLPISFACTSHQVFFQQDCPRRHAPPREASRLIARAADSTLHPAQCRQPDRTEGPSGKASACGGRLDEAREAGLPRPNASVLETQQRLLGALHPDHPAEDAARYYTNLRVITALPCASWPHARHLVDTAMIDSVSGHIRRLLAGGRPTLDAPPVGPIATAALLTAATAVHDSADLQGVLAQHLQAAWAGRPSKAPWAQILTRHQSSCSQRLLQAAEPLIRAYRRQGGSHSSKAPARLSGYRPEHIPALLEHGWYQRHLAPLGCGSPKAMRRTGAVLLVQWAAGGSTADAAAYLGINPNANQHAPSVGLYRWLRSHGSAGFMAALHRLARRLDAATSLIDYHQRRQALQEWCLDTCAWCEITGQLPPVPGPIQPALDDRERQEASAFIWAQVTQGELRFAPRPIEAMQPEPVRETWRQRRGGTWHQLTRPSPLAHYAELRKLLIQHAQHLAKEIDVRTETTLGASHSIANITPHGTSRQPDGNPVTAFPTASAWIGPQDARRLEDRHV
jgi:TniQ